MIRVVLLFFVAAIFLWVLQTRLASYKPPSPVRTLSAATLAINKRQAFQIDKKSDKPLGKAFLFLFCMALLARIASGTTFAIRRGQRMGARLLRSLYLSDVQSFLRPPPLLL
jgi:hypothetical protein